ncbi:Uma2 family endonuclease [Goodfellowiella coeruleoviolacea]|uniref:Endonuclease, Uma2 family (Restriction endonuclease fold) n=1 Tax=Goodfellowiella coeruleoviolacea TaxID=334858 RepID=A0AAE3GDW7_9PSEU|nr:Uma2 family endonuclease [Goodfellowiella coeruleoviolacea]MCP2166345.1 Endonuclease, Uma2 family (restriction endonuclease fold) [Goodfellowiella coeruleoviolacea]
MAAPLESESAGYLLPRHEGAWTIQDVLALPEDRTQRVELVDGALVVSPRGALLHQVLAFELGATLKAACPAGLRATAEIDVEMPAGNWLIPDFTVIRDVGFPAGLFPAEHVVLAGEVVSPSSRRRDRTLKRQLYAEARIPFYLVVDLGEEPVSAVLLELDGDGYREVVRSEAGKLLLDRPFPVTLELTV